MKGSYGDCPWNYIQQLQRYGAVGNLLLMMGEEAFGMTRESWVNQHSNLIGRSPDGQQSKRSMILLQSWTGLLSQLHYGLAIIHLSCQ